MSSDILQKFKNHFCLKLATTPELRSHCFQLRYQVFCEEFHFEPEHEDALETDLFDDKSIHCLLINKTTNQLAGTIRLIIKGSKALPFESFTKRGYLINHPMMTEVSRLTVAKQFRRRHSDGTNPKGIGQTKIKAYRAYPIPALSLICASCVLAKAIHSPTLYCMLEPKLASSLSLYGLNMKQIGKTTIYHGVRAPYEIKVIDFWQELNIELQELLLYINEIITLDQDILKVS